MTAADTHRKMPRQKPGKSKQDYATPREFIAAVEKRFGKLDWDLAATWRNAVTTDFYGMQESGVFRDSLEQNWRRLEGNLWLNPPFAQIAPWAAKCAGSSYRGATNRIFFLTPASVGANWFWQYVWPHALVLPIHPRLSFDGVDPYPKDLMLSVFNAGARTMERWVWR